MRLLRHASCLIALALCSSAASAQTATPLTAEERAPLADPPAADPPSAPVPVAAPIPPAAVPASAPIVRPYALLKPEFVFASKALESFGQPNASAPTAAGNPVLAALPNEAQTTFQAAQSRLGVWFDEKGPVRGHIEFDFVDFTKSSPTVASVPRLRIANVDWLLNEHLTLSAGQDWDLYAPINPYTLNITAVAFQAGNSGFIRQQARLIYHNDSVELGGALGLSAPNNTAKTGVPEFGHLPTLALRAAVLFGSAGRIGVSAIATKWRFAPGADNERSTSVGAVNLYGDVTPVAGFNIRFEGYGGKDLANLGSLTLGNGSVTNDIKEIGGFISAKYSLTESHALYMLAGTAKVLDKNKVVPAYTYPAAAGTDPAMPPLTSTATVAGTGPGMISNTTARLGYEYRYSKPLAVQLEGFMFHSHHVLNATFDTTRFDPVRTAFGAEIGLMYTL